MKHTFAGQPKYTLEDGVVKSDTIGKLSGWVIGGFFLMGVIAGLFWRDAAMRSDIHAGMIIVSAVLNTGFLLYKLIRYREIDWMYVSLYGLFLVLCIWWR